MYVCMRDCVFAHFMCVLCLCFSLCVVCVYIRIFPDVNARVFYKGEGDLSVSAPKSARVEFGSPGAFPDPPECER